jgi:outer membrane receptor for ferrienterochelin and colicin
MRWNFNYICQVSKNLPIVLFFLLALIAVDHAYAQSFKGQVVDVDNQPIPYASVIWYETVIGVTANDSGYFEIPFPPDTTLQLYRLDVSFGGLSQYYELNDLHSFYSFTMDIRVQLEAATIYDEDRGAYISRLIPIKTEIVTRDEMRKAACCDLAGCFETQSTVQPQTTNILTNAKELRILGLSGVYNQVLVDGLPVIQGLIYTYGISTIPGAIVDNIWVVKGANSVLQGYESMVGQITVYPREGQTADPFSADLLINSFNEKHSNIGIAHQKNQWNNFLGIHASLPGDKFDRDKDNFLDLPLLTRYSVYNKWRYRNENENGWSTFVSGRLTDEERIGGQVNFIPLTDAGSTDHYGQMVSFMQSELMNKTGYRFNQNSKISLYGSLVNHNQESWFGVLNYKAKQLSAYANLQFEWFYGKNKQQDLKAGVSFRHLDMTENISFSSDTIPRSFAGSYDRLDNIPGIFAENIFTIIKDTLTVIAGIRADYHADFGSKVTPRAMLRYLPHRNTDIRASFGTGWRIVNLFSENINLLTSGRDIIFNEAIEPEEAINAGINLTQRFVLIQTSFTFSLDLYHTNFSRQFFPDYDRFDNYVVIENFEGTSISNGLQLELMAAVSETADLRVAYNYLDVYREIDDQKVQLPFNARDRFLAVLSLHSPQPGWQVDFNWHYYGVQRLPENNDLSLDTPLPVESSPFSLLSIQYTQNFKNFELFAGCENVFDFRQKQPIISWQNPFSKSFDTSYAWGPTRGREFYVGIRYVLKD